MKTFRKATVILLFALLVATFTTGCAGCGSDTTQNTDDMVESTPIADEGIVEDNTLMNDTQNQNRPSDNATDPNGGNATADDITENPNSIVNDNGQTVDENGNIVSEAGDAVGDAMDNVGSAVDEVVDGVGNGVRDLTN